MTGFVLEGFQSEPMSRSRNRSGKLEHNQCISPAAQASWRNAMNIRVLARPTPLGFRRGFRSPLALPCLILLGFLSACQTPTIATGSRKAECAALFPPITYSAKEDTAETVAQVRAFNARRDKWCG